MYKKIQPFNYNYPFGKRYSLANFLQMHRTGKITPHDGTISEVIVDGFVTNILIENWNMYQIDEDAEIMPLKDLESISTTVEILWIGKK
jgi:hypothetical protein